MRCWGALSLVTSLILWATAAAGASFQEQLAQAPQCALTCAVDRLSTTTCAISDASCICNDTKFVDAVKQCVAATCTVREAIEAQTVIYGACGVPVRDHAATLLGIAIAFAIPSLFVCGVRFVIRARGNAWLGMDDVFIFLAMLLVFPVTAAVVMIVKYGLGKDLWGVDINNINSMLYWYFIAELCYISITALTKMSVICFYLRVFPNKPLRRNCYIVLALTTAAFIAFFFGALFQCYPISVIWKGWDGQHPGRCINVKALLYAQAVTTIVLDIPVLLIPIPALKDLALPRARKVGLFFVFGLGILTTIICILRFQGLVKFSLTSPDFSYQLASPAYWSLLEIHIGILCVCLPTMRPFFRAISFRLCGTPQNTGYARNVSSDPPRVVRLSRTLVEVDDGESGNDSTELVEIDKAGGERGFSHNATLPLDK